MLNSLTLRIPLQNRMKHRWTGEIWLKSNSSLYYMPYDWNGGDAQMTSSPLSSGKSLCSILECVFGHQSIRKVQCWVMRSGSQSTLLSPKDGWGWGQGTVQDSWVSPHQSGKTISWYSIKIAVKWCVIYQSKTDYVYLTDMNVQTWQKLIIYGMLLSCGGLLLTTQTPSIISNIVTCRHACVSQSTCIVEITEVWPSFSKIKTPSYAFHCILPLSL